jgi:hypothetical protein
MTKTLLVSLTLLMIPMLSATSLVADDHIVNSTELHQQLLGAAQARQSNVAKIEHFLSHDAVQKTMKATGMDAARVTQAVTLLGDEELARLADRAAKVETDFAAGALNNQQITYILIALGTAVVVLLIVHAK